MANNLVIVVVKIFGREEMEQIESREIEREKEDWRFFLEGSLRLFSK